MQVFNFECYNCSTLAEYIAWKEGEVDQEALKLWNNNEELCSRPTWPMCNYEDGGFFIHNGKLYSWDS